MFADEQLKKIAEDSTPQIEAYLKRLNQISDDIKALEKFMKESACPVIDIKILDDELIAWVDGRIMHGNKADMAPLIVRPIAIRLKCYSYLSKLLQESLRIMGEIK